MCIQFMFLMFTCLTHIKKNKWSQAKNLTKKKVKTAPLSHSNILTTVRNSISFWEINKISKKLVLVSYITGYPVIYETKNLLMLHAKFLQLYPEIPKTCKLRPKLNVKHFKMSIKAKIKDICDQFHDHVRYGYGRIVIIGL